MKYRIYFLSGESIVINENPVDKMNTAIKAQLDFIEIDYQLININFTTHIIPIDEGVSDIIKTPTPESIREAEKKKKEEIVKDPKAVLKDLQNEMLEEKLQT